MTADGTDAATGRPYDIFISYSRVDAARATQIRDLLVARGHHVFFDAEGIDAGAEFPDVIDRAVKGAKVVLGCWTPAAIQRRWVRIESRIGLDRGSLVAIGLEKMDPEELPAEFYNVNVLNLSDFDGNPGHAAWHRVLSAIDRRMAKGGAAATDTGDEVRPAAPRKRRFSPLALGGAAALAIAAVAGGGWYVASSGSAFDQAAVGASFDKTVKATEPVMSNALISALNDAEADNNGKTFWALAQLTAVERSLTPDEFRRFDAASAKFLAGACHCVMVDDAPFTIGSVWTLIAYGAVNRPPPAPVVEALLGAQNREGWWSSAMDAADRPDNAATYVTALSVIALRDIDRTLQGDPALRAKVKAARGRGVEWLKRRRPKAGANWADYPDNSLRTDAPSISAMATLALLPEVTEAEAKDIAAGYVAGIDTLSPVDQNVSNDIFVTRKSGATYVDAYRHVPLGWEVHALAKSYPYLSGEMAEKAARLLTDAKAISLSDPKLARQDWMLAEQFLGFRGARDALAAKKP